ncbi:dTDP-4-dehydrorhamnose 3,5-epimerase [Floricoccus tropicus]|uniref:dTDP-4-dehydrorhamnose 3,5-epimerase n=1 Tax=Floricoccus tropicus TaxID=1859473 RepID=A0A1E8GN21_9LACT|nr:dTDP-4-dehydrorhamnose 3,5-epimerase [Floricoccus tropicus]OFI49664.1 dTDP-4-dehydrorhamnose 3,5-epimerase [Floricoccus tropicus]
MEAELHIEPFKASESKIKDLKIINTKRVTDNRGTVRELYRESAYSSINLESGCSWKQINLTRTKRGAVRGLHGEAMSKLVTVAYGSAFGVYVDTRRDSSTFGNVVTVELLPGVQVFVPQGVCNGFQALTDDTEYLYFFDNEWAQGMSGVALTPLDPKLGIKWPLDIDINDLEQISEKDMSAPTFEDFLKQ